MENQFKAKNVLSHSLQGRIKVNYYVYIIILLLCTTVSAQNGGELVESFGGDGVILSTEQTINYKGVVQPDGKILVLRDIAYITQHEGSTLRVEWNEVIRLNQNGSQDNDFRDISSIRFPEASSTVEIDDFALQPDGKIVILLKNQIYRFNSDGSKDEEFGLEGMVEPEFSPFGLKFNVISVDISGKITIAGLALLNNEHYGLVYSRMNTNGTYDYELSGTGFRIINNGFSVPTKIETDNQFRTIISVENFNYSYNSILYRFKNNGSLDNSFEDDGKVNSEKLIHFAVNMGNGNIAYITNGKLNIYDETTGTFVKNIDVNAPPTSVCFQNDGRIVVGLEEQLNYNSYRFWQLQRFIPDGTVDHSFGTNGIVSTTYIVGDHNFNNLAAGKERVYALGDVIPETGNDLIPHFGLIAAYSDGGIYSGNFPEDQTLSTDPGKCFATAGNMDPVIYPPIDDINLRYKIERYPTTVDEGEGSVTGKQFNLANSMVTYFYNDGEEKFHRFNVTVKDEEEPVANCKDIIIYLDENGTAALDPEDLDNDSTDNCTISSYTLSKTTFDCSTLGLNEVTLTVKDSAGNESYCTATVLVEDNTSPEAQCMNVTIALDANGNAILEASQIDDGSNDTCGIASLEVSKASFNCNDVGDNLVTLTVTDNNGNTATCDTTVTVEDNLLPTVLTTSATLQLDANGAASITAAQIDNGSYDNCGVKSVTLDKTTFGCSDVGENEVTLTVIDENDNEATATATVTVEDKIAPVITNLSANPEVLFPVNRKLTNVAINYGLIDNCPGTTSEIIGITVVDDGVGGGLSNTNPDWEIIDAHNVRLRAERPSNGNGRSYFVEVMSTDASGNSSSETVEVKVAHNINSPRSGRHFRVGSTVDFAAEFWDSSGKTHSANWSLDGSNAGSGEVIEPSGNRNGQVNGSYNFNTPGVYKLQMSLTDNAGNTTYTNTHGALDATVVIYDPNGGYTYGGGWFDSPPGALVEDAEATGKASYGFTVNYFGNASKPKGEAQFRFEVGDFEFNALNFDYLVINQGMAQFRGTGKIIGGRSGIGFTMTVSDGQIDGTGTDKIRMKIYHKRTGEIYYDNQPGASDADLPTKLVGQDSEIVIQDITPAYNAPIEDELVTEPTIVPGQFEVHLYPNPSDTNFKVQITTNDLETPIKMLVFDGVGRLVEQNKVSAGSSMTFGDLYQSGVFLVSIVQGNQRKDMKVIKF